MDSVQVDLELDLSSSDAFAAFTGAFFEWWPRDYSYSGELVENLVLGAGSGAMCSEFGPEGFRIDFGRILDWSPPERLSIGWQISPDSRPEPDPLKASRVSVSFLDAGHKTHVRLIHDQFGNHGDGAEAYASEMASVEGWPHIMELFRTYARNLADEGR